MAHSTLGTVDSGMPLALAAKQANNVDIIERNDARACWAECPVRYPVAARPRHDFVNRVVIDTNTFCPARCVYCSQAYPADAPEWGPHAAPLPGNDALGLWGVRNRQGQWVAPVFSTANRHGRLLDTIRSVVEGLGRPSDLWIEFTGGDSAYHPEFREAAEWLVTQKVRVIYLSSGLLPTALIGPVLDLVASGLFYVTVSTDAASPEVWSRIKRKPATLFDRVLDFLGAAAERQVANQVAVKFIVLHENLGDAADFIPFFAGGGLKKFVVSEYRAQPVHFVGPPSEAEMAEACRGLWLGFERAPLEPRCELIIDGLERHFRNRGRILKNELMFAGL